MTVKEIVKECRKKNRAKAATAVKKYKHNSSLAMVEKELVSDVTIMEVLHKAGLRRMYFDQILNGIIFECVRKPVFEDGKEWLEEV